MTCDTGVFDKGSHIVKRRLTALALVLLATACSKEGEITQGGIYVTRSACPQVGIPAATGDITLFNPANRTDAAALDVSLATVKRDLRSARAWLAAELVRDAA